MTSPETTHSAHRTWFVTGATSGIGLAMTHAALLRGDKVTGTGLDTTKLQHLAEQYPEQLVVVGADVRDPAAITGAVDRAVSTFGHIDVLAINAAVGVFGGVEEISDDQWRSVYDVNIFGTLNILRAALPQLRSQHSGHILMASAHYGQSSHAGVSAVSTTKHAMEALTDSLAEEVAPLGIRVTSFAPGFTATNFRPRLGMAENLHSDYDQTVRAAMKAASQIPDEVINTPEAVVDALLTILDVEQPPKRLATGGVSYTFIKDSLTERLANLEEWSELTHSVDAANPTS